MQPFGLFLEEDPEIARSRIRTSLEIEAKVLSDRANNALAQSSSYIDAATRWTEGTYEAERCLELAKGYALEAEHLEKRADVAFANLETFDALH